MPCHGIRRTQYPMILSGEDHETRRDLAALKSREDTQCVSLWDAIILAAMDNQGRCRPRLDETSRVPHLGAGLRIARVILSGFIPRMTVEVVIRKPELLSLEKQRR